MICMIAIEFENSNKFINKIIIKFKLQFDY